ncbi:hypothetical protein BDQ12DRAFT_719611 [Crucibulum laeve]|uniref:Arrestin-like N-terminal domain-containing protein n=1 Tax=Crucibulum laeve TaxID=68775 RepID=A0A5C3MCX9_9AGAR|nr:hypothetical protein BDQ12DRAFT_719611 [Crucibulum laeve]
MFSDDDTPPTYNLDETQPLPAYSSNCGSTECVLQMEAPRVTGCPGCDWIYETKHMKINLGSRIWGLHAPTYGLNGKVEGELHFSGDKERVESITATLEGRLRTTLAQRGSSSGDQTIPLVTQSITLFDTTMSESFEWDQALQFSIPIPDEVEICGSLASTPPSYFAYHQHVSCEISYFIKFNMIRKGHALKKNEMKSICILYLPKTRPVEPPITTIPRPSRLEEDVSSFLHMFERVKTITLTPFHPLTCKSKTALDGFRKSVYLSLPTPLCFSSGNSIPFTLSLVFPDDPVLAQLLARNMRIQLLKRILVWRKGGSEPVHRDTLAASATLRYGREYKEGVNLLRGDMRAGDMGRESSWRIEDVAELQNHLAAA